MSVIAVSLSDAQRFGCPYCSHPDAYFYIGSGAETVYRCGSSMCRKTYIVLGNGVTECSIFGFHRDGRVIINGSHDDCLTYYPALRPHPQRK